MQKENENLGFDQGVKDNGTIFLLIFGNCCEAICPLKAFVDIVTSRRNRRMSTTYKKHNRFHQSELEREVELQTTHIVLFKSPRDVMQVSTLSAQLGLGSELVDWYRDATSVPYGHLVV